MYKVVYINKVAYFLSESAYSELSAHLARSFASYSALASSSANLAIPNECNRLNMNGEFVKYKGLIAVAVGAGFMIGSAGVFLFQQYFGERKRVLLQQEVDQLGFSVTEIRRELSVLRNHLQMAQRNTRQDTTAPSVITDAETEMLSTFGGDDQFDEFYELSSDNDTAVEENKGSSFEKIDELLEGTSREDKTKAYGLLLEILVKEDENDEVLWRLAKACHMMSSLHGAEGDNDKKKEFIFKGVEFGQKAIQLNSSNWRAHKWYAVCVGGRGQLQGVKEKLQDGHTFKEHIDKALAINPEDAILHHLLGRFNFEVASLSWLERKVANTIFGKVPEGSYEDAIKSLLEAERLNPTAWKDNRLLIAKCYAALRDYSEALKWLDSARDVPTISAEDKLADKEIQTLLQKCEPYRIQK